MVGGGNRLKKWTITLSPPPTNGLREEQEDKTAIQNARWGHSNRPPWENGLTRTVTAGHGPDTASF